jgi:hypothetical protein
MLPAAIRQQESFAASRQVLWGRFQAGSKMLSADLFARFGG